MQEILLPHFNNRKKPISMLVLHCSAFHCTEALKSYDEANVSVHYFLDEDGSLTKMVDEANRAWHAGIASWREYTEDINSCSIGIELYNKSLGETPYSEAQIEKLIPFCQKIIRKYNIPPQNVVAHSDIAPTRKMDPGISFPWKRLAKEGIGLWYQIRYAEKINENNVSILLQQIGYKIDTKEDLIAAAYAFRRRFLPQEIKIIDNIKELIDHPYPVGNEELLQGEKFLKTLKAVAYTFKQA